MELASSLQDEGLGPLVPSKDTYFSGAERMVTEGERRRR